MRAWPRHPSIYEINTWVWLAEVSRKAARPVTLASVPDREWDTIAGLGFDAVWLMGVWERSPAGTAIANRNEALRADFLRALRDFRVEDNVGSPYCVRRYVVDAHLGGREGLAAARQALAQRGLRLVLDFVPNHVACDHPWVSEHPEYFIRGNAQDLARDPSSFVERAGQVLACGRDPYFPPWPDVLQLNAFVPSLRAAAIRTLREIASQSDAVRCDMAMLMLNSVFARTWGERTGRAPQVDYWREIIPAVRADHSDFKLIAEAYWDLEWELQQQGFDYCYDKRLYDRLEHSDVEAVRLHLCADPAYQARLVRFLENHDEPRAALTFDSRKARAVAVAVLTLPGAKLVHEGQLEGRRVRVPVFLARRPEEAADEALRDFYGKLLRAVANDAFRNGEWRLCERTGWPDNASFRKLLAWCWQGKDTRYVVVVNLSGAQSQANIRLSWEDPGHGWRFKDQLSAQAFERQGLDDRGPGLFVDLPPWGSHLLRAQPA